MIASTARRLVAGILCMTFSPVLHACTNAEQAANEQVAATPVVDYGATVNEWVTAQEAAVATTVTTTAVVPPTAAPPAAVEPAAVEPTSAPTTYTDAATGTVYQVLEWEHLVPPEFQAEAIMQRYQEELAALEDGDPEAMAIYEQMQQEFANAPANEALDDTLIRLPGFIAPLDYTEEVITEFLLVPYFGACIHVPPPPANQTVLVTATAGNGIRSEDAYEPVWVQGLLKSEGTTTDLATAGYSIHEATIHPYESN